MRPIQHFLVCILLLLPLLSRCSKSTVSSPQPAQVFEIHFQTWYSATPVKVAVDGKTVLSDSITTSAILAYAAIVPVELDQGKHHFHIEIDAASPMDTTLYVADSLYVGVDYDSSGKQITIHTQIHPFLYR